MQSKEIEMPFSRVLKEERYEMKADLTNWLLTQRLSNYGYDLRDFKNLGNKASRLRGKLRSRGLNLEGNYGIFNRLMVQAIGEGEATSFKISYCCGQSWNEEYITLLECFTF